MRLLPALAIAFALSAPAIAAPMPDALVVTGPNLQQIPIGRLLVTPIGGTQATLGFLLSGPGLNLASPSPIGSTAPNTGAFTDLSFTGTVNGAAVTLSGLLTLSQPASISIGGSRAWSGSQTSVGNAQIWSFTNQSGSTSAGPAAAHFMGIASDTVHSTGVSFANLEVDTTTSAGILGGRNNIWANLTINGTPGDTGQYVAGTFAAGAKAPANASGNILYGINPTCGITGTATGAWSCVGGEIDVASFSGATPTGNTGLAIVLVNGHAVRGSSGLDSGIVFGNQSTNPGWKYGIRFCGPSIACPFGTDSTLIYGYAGTTTNFAAGVDFTNYTFSAAAFKSTGFQIDGSGNETAPSIGNGASAFKISGSGQWTANGAVATTMTSLGPTGSHATVQEWLTFTDASGTVRYIPAY